MIPAVGRNALTLAIVVLLGAASPVHAIDRATQERLDRIERKLDARGLVDMLNQLEALQRDVQQLRGELEVQTHRLSGMERRQREQYLDIDRRLQALESGASSASAPGSGGPVTDGNEAEAAAGTATNGIPAAEVDAAAARTEYDTALAVLREGRYADAAAAFKQFLTRYPSSSYTGNASYWLGETYYVTREFEQALTTFRALVAQHPDSPKVADSRLKIGFIHYENKDWKAARKELEAVVAGYPGSTAARLAGDRLARMKKEGR